MNIILKLYILTIFSLPCFCLGQNELSGFYLESRNKADFVIDELVKKGHFDFSPYALLASNNTYYFIVLDRKTHFSMVWVELNVHGDVIINKVKNKSKSNQMLNKIFEFNLYNTDFISFDSEFYKDGYDLASGAPTYFVIKNMKGKRFGESVLSMLVSPNPINKKIFGFMASELISGNK